MEEVFPVPEMNPDWPVRKPATYGLSWLYRLQHVPKGWKIFHLWNVTMVNAIVAITPRCDLRSGGLFFVTLKDYYELDSGEVSPRGKHAFPSSRFPAKNRSPGTQSTLVIPSPPLLFHVMFFFLCVVRKGANKRGWHFPRKQKRGRTHLLNVNPARS
jgi:hypothetical protein